MSDLKTKLLKAGESLDTITSIDLRKLVLDGDPEVIEAVNHMKDLVESISIGQVCQESFDELFEKMLENFDEKYHEVLKKYGEIVKKQKLTPPNRQISNWKDRLEEGYDPDKAIDYMFEVYGPYFEELSIFISDIRKIDKDLYDAVYRIIVRLGKSLSDYFPLESDKIICKYIQQMTINKENWKHTQYTSRSTKFQSTLKQLDKVLGNDNAFIKSL